MAAQDLPTRARARRAARGGAGRPASALALAALLAGCAGPQSALDPAGVGAEAIATLFWAMLAGAAVIWVAVIGGAVYAGRFQKTPIAERTGLRLVLWAGAIVPTIVLCGLLIYGLRLMPPMRGAAPDLTIEVTGEQFWWRVAYRRPDGTRVAAANEIRMPAGATVEFVLNSADVIHAFWIPSLGGKIDMIPGRTTRLILQPTKPGTFRGACTEFCGTSHALMAFSAVVMAPADFEAWLAAEAAPATRADAPDGDAAGAAAGREAFLRNGCGACHTVRGTAAAGTVGPDLTHVGSRTTIAAGILENTAVNRARFITEAERIKPGIRMPSFGMLPPAEIEAIADYLGGLR